MEKIKAYRAPFYYLSTLWKEKGRILYMALHDLKSSHRRSFLGVFWAYFQPVVMMGLMIIIFTYGFRSGSMSGDVPFPVYLITGFVSWTFIAGMFSSGASSISAYSFLIKKVDFPLFILPVVKQFSELYVHLVIVVLVGIVVFLFGIYPGWYWLQIFYYLFSAIVLMLGVSWFTASVSLFIPDIQQIMQILVQLGFWVTPIFWSVDNFPPWVRLIVKINPAYYIVNGYRESFIYGIGFWEHPWISIYYWCVTLLFLIIGSITYRNTRPHFAEVVQ